MATGNQQTGKRRRPESVGRFDDLHRAGNPPGGEIAPAPPTLNIRTAVGAVQDPWGKTGNERVRARVNIKVSLLESERHSDRISEAAYRVGQELQHTFEAATRVGNASNWEGGSRVDGSTVSDAMAERGVDLARKIEAIMAAIRRAVGEASGDAELLRDTLGDGMSFLAIATERHRRSTLQARQRAQGEVNRKSVARIADRWRHALETLAEGWGKAVGTGGRPQTWRAE